MREFKSLKNEKVTKLLKSGKVGVVPTDTIYGVVGLALLPETVERIYGIKDRNREKPMIVLVDSTKNLKKDFDIDCPERIVNLWPAKLSVILSCKKYPHIHRGKKTIAFRIPDSEKLRDLIFKTGPLVAPSANPEGRPPALTIEKAKTYFGSRVDFYVDEGELNKKSSTLVKCSDGDFKVLRRGEFNLERFR